MFQQRMVTKICDDQDENQVFVYKGGRLHLAANSAKLCVGYFSETNTLDTKGEKMMLVRCQANVWGTGAMTDESCDKKRLIAEPVQLTTFPDKNIKLFGDYGDYCWVKKFAGYIVYQEIFVADCADATNDNSSIRGKYQWTYNP